jgi:prophage DNA circulation protein
VPALEKNIRPASFRGVPFGVLDASDQRGRNTVIHEFPLRDKVFVEDMGRARRSISLTAFVVGPGFEARRDALIAALEKPGPGTLVHPWLGTFQASLSALATIDQSAQDGGYVAFGLQFVEDMAPEAPGPGLDWPSIAMSRLAEAAALAGAALDAAFILRPVFEEALAVGLGWAAGLASALAPIYGAVAPRFTALASAVASFAGQIAKAGSLSILAGSFWPSRDHRAMGGAQAAREAEGFMGRALALPENAVPAGLGTVGLQTATNLQAVTAFDREMSGLSGLAAAAFAVPASGAEADRLRGLATMTADRLMGLASTEGLFRATRRLHVATQRALSDAAGRAPRVVEAYEQQAGPALALAWRHVLAGQASGGIGDVLPDLVRRNGVRHPGFVPAGRIEVLRGQA